MGVSMSSKLVVLALLFAAVQVSAGQMASAPAASNTLLVAGQGTTFSTSITQGSSVPPYTVSLITSSGATVTTVTGASPGTVTFNPIYPPAGTDSYNVSVTDSNGLVFNSTQTSITVDPALSVSVNALNVTDVGATSAPGQTQTLSITVTGGTGGPYSVTAVFAGSTSIPVGSAASVTAGTPTLISFNACQPSGACSSGSLKFYISVTDTGTTSPYVNNSTTINVNTYKPGFATFGANNTVMDLGQSAKVSETANPGASPFTVNYIYTNNGVSADYITGLPGTFSSSFVFTPSSAGTYIFNAVANDMGTTAPWTVATSTNTKITAASAPTMTLTPSATSFTSGQTITYTITVNGGTGPFTAELFNVTGSGKVANATIATPSGSNTVSFTAEAQSTRSLVYEAIVTDTGTNSPYVFNSVTNTIEVSPTSTGSSSSSTTTSTTTTTTSTTTSTSTTTTSTTTIPVTNAVNVTGTTANVMINVSTTGISIVNLNNGTAILAIKSKTNGTENVTIKNVTKGTSGPSGLSKLSVYNVSVMANASVKQNTTVSVTLAYNCGIPSNRVAAYIFTGGAWKMVSSVSVNATACTATFSIPNDPVFGLFETPPPATTTSTSTSSTTTVQTNSSSGSSAPPSQPSAYGLYYIIGAAVVVVIIIIAVLASRRRRPPKPDW